MPIVIRDITTAGIEPITRPSSVTVNVRAYGAKGDGTTDDRQSIQDALNACPSGGTVILPPGIYRTGAALVVPPNIILRGAHGPRIIYDAATSISVGEPLVAAIRPLASFTANAITNGGSGTNVQSTAVIRVIDKELGSYTNESGGQRIENLYLNLDAIDQSTGPRVDGIQAIGRVRDVTITKVSIRNPTGDGVRGNFYLRADGTTTVNPFSWTLNEVITLNAKRRGFTLGGFTDTRLLHCQSIGSTLEGFYIESMGNSTLTACRAEWAKEYGFLITGSSSDASVSLIGCTTDHNVKAGLRIVATGKDPINISNFTARRDGSGPYPYASPAGAGVEIVGCTNAVIITGLTVLPGVDDLGAGSPSPLTGLSVGTSTDVLVTGGSIHGFTTAITDAGGNTRFFYDQIIAGTGPKMAPTRTFTSSSGGGGGGGSDGTAALAQVALKVSAHRKPPTFFGRMELVENFQAGNGWALDSGSPGSWTNPASSLATHGSVVGRLTTDAAGGTSSASNTGNTAVNLNGKQILWTFAFTAPQIQQSFAGLMLRAAPTGGLAGGNHITWNLANTSIGDNQALVHGGVPTTVALSLADGVTTGSPTLSSITEWQVLATSRTSGPTGNQALQVNNCGIDIASNGVPISDGRGIVSFTFDDSYLWQYSVVRQEMHKRGLGWAGTIMPIVDLLGTDAAQYMTLPNLFQMRREGWEIGTHAYTQAVHNSFNPGPDNLANTLVDFQLAHQWNADQGFAGTSIAYPNGVHGFTSVGNTASGSPLTGAGTPPTVKLPYSEHAARWWSIARTTSSQYPGAIHNPLPQWNPMKTRAITPYGVGAPSFASIIGSGGVIEQCRANNTLVVFTLHRVVASGTTLPGASSPTTASTSTTLLLSEFQQLLDKVQSAGCTVATLGQVADAYLV